MIKSVVLELTLIRENTRLIASIIVHFLSGLDICCFKWIKLIIHEIKKMLSKNQLGYAFSLKGSISVSYFFSLLDISGIDYVIVRSFKDPKFQFNKDIDIMIRDSSKIELLKIIRRSKSILTNRTPLIEVHLEDYYPKKLSSMLLDNKIRYYYYFIPDKETYQASIYYHWIFRKGINLNNNEIMRSLIEKNKVDSIHDLQANINMETAVKHLMSYDAYIYGENLYKFIGKSPGNRDWFYKRLSNYNLNKRLHFFVMRNLPSLDNLESHINRVLSKYNYQLIMFSSLNNNQTEYSLKYLRGGNWSKGNFREFVGDPKYILVCWNNSKLRQWFIFNSERYRNFSFPQVSLKRKIRNELIKVLKIDYKQYHFIHGPDSHYELNAYYEMLNDSQRDLITQFEYLKANKYHGK